MCSISVINCYKSELLVLTGFANGLLTNELFSNGVSLNIALICKHLVNFLKGCVYYIFASLFCMFQGVHS